MRKLLRDKVKIGAFAFIVLALAGLYSTQTPARFSGKPVDDWFVQLTDDSTIKQEEAKAVFRRIGARSLPFLLSQVRAEKPKMHDRLISWFREKIQGQTIVGVCGMSDLVEGAIKDERLIRAFNALRDNANPAIPKLEALLTDPSCQYSASICLAAIGDEGVHCLGRALTNSDARIRQTAVYGLEHAKADSEAATILLLIAMSDPDGLVRHYTAHALGELHARPDLVIPALIKALGDTDSRVRYISVFALGRFGADAVPALQSLRMLKNDVEESVRDAATEIAVELGAAASANAQ